MNTVAFNILLAAGMGQTSAVTTIITIVVWGVFIIGAIALAKSLHAIAQEAAALKWVEQKLGSAQLSTEMLQKEILNREDTSEMPYLENSLVYSRLNEIARVLSRDKKNSNDSEEKQVTPPQLQDMHRMTLQEMQSRPAPTWLRITASVLLIIGICGTLWGVHACIGNQHGATSQLAALGSALEPSKFAVLFTVLLYVGQSWYLMRLERFICYLDRLTMTKFLPDLQPASSFSQTMQQVAQQVQQFGQLISGFDSIEKTVKEMQNTAEKFTQIAEGYEQRSLVIKKNLDAIDATGKNIEGAYQQLHDEVQAASESVERLALQLGTAIKREDEVETAAQSFAEMLENLKSHIATVENAAGLVVATQQSLANLTDGAAALAPLQSSVVSLGENCLQLKEQVSQTRDETLRVKSALSDEVQRLHGSFEGLASEVHKTTSDVEQMAANATEFKQYAEEMRNQMRDTLEKGKKTIQDQSEHRTEINDNLQQLNERFGRLNTAVRGN